LAGGVPGDGSMMGAMGDPAGLVGGGFGGGGSFGGAGMGGGGLFGGGGPGGGAGASLGGSPGSVGLSSGGMGGGMPGSLQRRSASTSANVPLEGGPYGAPPGALGMPRSFSAPLGYGAGLPGDSSSLGGGGAAGDLFAVSN
jgi:hypothetical protein